MALKIISPLKKFEREIITARVLEKEKQILNGLTRRLIKD